MGTLAAILRYFGFFSENGGWMMQGELFPQLTAKGYEQLVFCHDRESGLRSMIAVHNTNRGPGLGGCRFFPYASEADALCDVLNLSRAMTYKAAMADLPLGGAKAIIWGNPEKEKTEDLWRAYGKCVDRLNGAYITTEDSGTNTADMDIVRQVTRHVTGTDPSKGGSGDPSPLTALGVSEGISASYKFFSGSEDLTGKRIAIQGMGNVGFHLGKLLKEKGANLVVSEINSEKLKRAVEELGAEAVSVDEIFGVECEVFAPCALGGAVNSDTIDQFKCKIIAGGANNQLREERFHGILENKGILYAPDYVINAGGLIHVGQEVTGWDQNRVNEHTRNIANTLTMVYERSQEEKRTPGEVADQMAEERFAKN